MSSRNELARRCFLKTSALAMAATAVPFSVARAEGEGKPPASKNDRPRVALIGAGGQGTGDARNASRFGDIVAVCDVDLNNAKRAQAAFGGTPDVYQDYRELIERSDIDVIVNGTPDHWHTPINVAALRAGKDVYGEKPMTLTIDEGKILRGVVAETDRVMQVGTQQRSAPQFQTAVELVRNGRIGNLRQVWVALPYYSTKCDPFPKQEVPENLDWDLYQGQASVHDYCFQRTHRNFRWWYEYAGGIITDWGNHHMDIAHWGMDCETAGPKSIEARGMFPNEPRPDCFNTPDRFFSRMIYPTGVEVLYFSSLGERLLYGGYAKAHDPMTPEQIDWLVGADASEEIKTMDRNGIMFIGEEGRIFVNRGGVYGKAVDQLTTSPLPEDAWRVRPSRDHMGNFFQCVHTREEPVSPVRIQHRTISACHLTNISIRLGRKLTWDPMKEEIVGDAEAQAMVGREQRAPYAIEG